MLAFNILIGEVDPNEEKGYIPSLYYGIRSCLPERHVHVLGDTQFLSHLIIKAEPELKGGYVYFYRYFNLLSCDIPEIKSWGFLYSYNLCSQRERHAKTIEIAQEEVLTCLGIYLYERLHRIWQRLQEMEQIWQILFHVGVDCLKKNFEVGRAWLGRVFNKCFGFCDFGSCFVSFCAAFHRRKTGVLAIRAALWGNNKSREGKRAQERIEATEEEKEEGDKGEARAGWEGESGVHLISLFRTHHSEPGSKSHILVLS